MKNECDEIRGMLHEVISRHSQLMDEYGDANNLEEPVWEGSNVQRCEEDPNEDADEYEGCTKCSKLSVFVYLNHLKCLSKWSNESFMMLLELCV